MDRTREILLLAAKEMYNDAINHGYCCIAIEYCGRFSDDGTFIRSENPYSWEERKKALDHFVAMFKPEGRQRGDMFWPADEPIQTRIEALLAAADAYVEG